MLRSLASRTPSMDRAVRSILRALGTVTNAGKADLVTAEISGRTLEVRWSNGAASRYDASWLRHNCHCPQCRQPGSGQKMVNFSALSSSNSLTVAIERPSQGNSLAGGCADDTVLQITWANSDGCDGHVGTLPVGFLRQVEADRQGYCRRTPPFWKTKKLPVLQYNDLPCCLSTDSAKQESEFSNATWKLLEHLAIDGVCLIAGVPTVPGTVAKVASMISPVQQTIYGKIFDVVAVPDQQAINIAYTNEALAPHMDLAYYESPPGLQLLHCLRFDEAVEGGESTFVDGFYAAEELRRTSPAYYSTLLRIPATFQKIHYQRELPVDIKYQRPHITENHKKQITSITWAPAFEGPLLTDTAAEARDYYDAYYAFAKIINDPENTCQHRLQPGELIVFNNRRQLHGRKAFRLNGGQRFLQGCYTNIDEFRSKINVFARLNSKDNNHYRVMNHCFL